MILRLKLKQESPEDEIKPSKLRIEFIGMAFALAIGEIGVEIGKLYDKNIRIRDHPFIATHILLVVFITASSWIGWQLSTSRGNMSKLRDPFSLAFLVLLIDLLLVICYFVMGNNIGRAPTKPSANSEVVFSMAIFFFYCIWDILTKILVEHPSTYKISIVLSKKCLLKVYQAILCLLIIYLFIWPIRNEFTSRGVICIDILLLSVFIFFRALKKAADNGILFTWYVILPIIVFIIIIWYYYHL